MKKTKQTKAQLRRRLVELEAQLSSSYHFAGAALSKVTYPKLMASGVILELTILGQRETVIPVCIRGGLSEETVRAIKADLKRSYDESVEFKPV